MFAPVSVLVSRFRAAGTKRRRLAVVAISATVALLAAGLTVGIATSASADPTTGEVSGSVQLEQSDGTTYLPAAQDEVAVKAWLLSDDGTTATNAVQDQTTTDADGNWSFDDSLVPGDYIFEFDDRDTGTNITNTFSTPESSNQYYTLNDALHEQQLSSDAFFEIGEDAPLDTGTLQLQLGNVVTGTVTSNTSHPAPLKSQPITIYREQYDADGNESMQDIGRGTTTATNGTYTISGLPSGTFTLSAGGASGYAPQYWDDEYVAGPDGADQFTFASSGETQSNFDFALDSGASISGTVKDTSGKALSGIVVTAYASEDDAYNQVSTAPHVTTSSTGAYSFTSLPSGDYTVAFSSAAGASVHYLTQYWQDVNDPYEADDVDVELGSKITGINATMAKAAMITGTISAPVDLASGDYTVYACEAYDNGDGTYDGYSCEDTSNLISASVNYSTGAYTLSNLPASTYTVYVAFTGPENVQSGYYPNSVNVNNVGAVKATAGATTAGANVQLQTGATISGHVSADGNPVSGANVGAYEDSDGTDATQGHNEIPDRTATTDASGNYTINGLGTAGFGVKVDGTGSAATQWYSSASSEYAAQTLSVTAPNATTGIDFTLQADAVIKGTVTAADTTDPLSNVKVIASLYRSSGATISDTTDTTYTDNAGKYSFNDLAAGDYQIQFVPDEWSDGYLPSYYGGSASHHLTVGAGSTTTANASLNHGGTYTGTVVDSAGDPLANVPLYPVTSDDWDQYKNTLLNWEPIYTNDAGAFTVVGLPVGTNTLYLEPAASYDESLDNYLNSQVTGGAVTVNAAPVDLGNVVVHEGSSISGLVIGTDGKAVPNVDVVATPVSSGEPSSDLAAMGAGATLEGGSDSSGRFDLTGAPEGTYDLEFLPDSDSPYGPQYLGGGSSPSASTPVTVTAENQTIFKEVRLYTGGALTGTVTSKATGRAISGVEIDAYQSAIAGDSDDGGFENYGGDFTNSKGAYVIPGLTAGGYSVGFDNYSSSYAGQTDSVYVPDKTTVKQNASLASLVTVSGTVTDHTSAPVTDENVIAYPVVDGAVDYDAYADCAYGCGDEYETATDEEGNYTIQLPPGTWALYFSSDDPSGGIGADVYLGDTYDAAAATQLLVGTHAITGQDVSLPTLGGGIQVEITHDNDDALSGSVTVERIVDGDVVSFRTNSSEDGSLGATETTDNLPPGTYRVTVNGDTQAGNYAPYVIDNVTVDGSVVDAGTADLTGIETDEDSPQVVPGAEPSILVGSGLKVGDTLAADPGTWDQTPTYYVYHWLRDGKYISGATSSTYTLAPGDAGKHISLAIGASSDPDSEDGDTPPLSYTTPPTDVVQPGDPALVTTAPAVTGTLKVGSTLTASSGSWDLPGLRYSYVWTRTKIGASPTVVSTSSTYKPTTSDVWDNIGQASLTLTVTATRSGFEDATATVNVGHIIPSTALAQTKASKVTANGDGSYSVSPGTWNHTGGTISYQWMDYATGSASGIAISGATTSTLAAADVPLDSTRVTVLVTGTKAGYATTSYEFLARSGEQTTFTGVDPTGIPALTSGAVWKPGYTVSVDPSTLATSPGVATYAYTWLRGGVAIKGATSASYTLSSSDVGKEVDVRVTATATGHPASAPVTILGQTVTASSSFDTTTTTITGTPAEGRTLTVNISEWAPAPTSVTYKWLRDGVTISGATKSTHALTAADVGHSLTVSVTGKRTGLTTMTAMASTGTVTTLAPVDLIAPSIPNSVTVGTKVTAVVGKWDVTPTSYAYQWYLNGNAIPAATASTYTPLGTDLDNDLSVAVTAVKTGLDAAAPVFSNAVTIDPGAAIVASKAPSLTVSAKTVKSLKLGQVVAASSGVWPVAALSLSYQWQVELAGTSTWTDLDGQTTKTLYLDPDDSADFAIGNSYRMDVSALRVGYLTGADAISASLAITG
jgi:hypothetical protein